MSTNAQAIAWGYRKAIEIFSKNCDICRRPRKKLKDLTLKELRNRISSGDIHDGAIGNLLVQNKRDSIVRQRREAVEGRWRKVRAQAWGDLLKASTPEYARVRKQKQMHSQATEQTTPTPLSTFFSGYHEAMLNVRALLSIEKKRGDTTPNKGYTWHDYIPNNIKHKLNEQWQEIPMKDKQHLKQPEIFKPLTTQPKE
jgi:hypothetical protein